MISSFQLFVGLFLIVNIHAFGQKVESVLWQITGNGMPKASYLFGTDHIASAELLDRFPGRLRSTNKQIFHLDETAEMASKKPKKTCLRTRMPTNTGAK